ncbi:MAG: hypothetical protein R8G01_09290 [Ilumatobacteraceae bacterium]|nr:hypothetical protein [Ilumatobacteraceae bacterium]
MAQTPSQARIRRVGSLRRVVALGLIATLGFGACSSGGNPQVVDQRDMVDEVDIAQGTIPSSDVADPASTTPPASSIPSPSVPDNAFFEDFTGNTGMDNFDTGMFHRDDVLVANTQWYGDHDTNCGDPSTQRLIHRDRPDESFYMCRDHMMTSVGDTSGYSIAWFAPKQTFEAGTHTSVSWDVNVTDLGNRQWWEVSIVPVGTPFLASIDWMADTAEIDYYDRRSIVVGKGPFGNDGNIYTQGVDRDPLGYSHVCGADPEGCDSKAIRRTFTITDNRNGTVTVDYLGDRYTYPGEFPDEFKVYFKDHSYTPDKDGTPAGHTWHWDTISVK